MRNEHTPRNKEETKTGRAPVDTTNKETVGMETDAHSNTNSLQKDNAAGAPTTDHRPDGSPYNILPETPRNPQVRPEPPGK